MKAELFTMKHQKKGLTPAGLRNGTKLKIFQYIEGTPYPFLGVDSKGVQHLWKESGRKNGEKNNMFSDLVYEVQDPNEIFLFIAVTPNGNGYANANLEKLRASMKDGSYDVYALSINKKTGTGNAAKQFTNAIPAK
jgi:hypothetical protein